MDGERELIRARRRRAIRGSDGRFNDDGDEGGEGVRIRPLRRIGVEGRTEQKHLDATGRACLVENKRENVRDSFGRPASFAKS